MTKQKLQEKKNKEPGKFPYMPGTEDIVREILRNEAIKTIMEYDTDRETMYLYVKPTYNKLTGELLNTPGAFLELPFTCSGSLPPHSLFIYFTSFFSRFHNSENLFRNSCSVICKGSCITILCSSGSFWEISLSFPMSIIP